MNPELLLALATHDAELVATCLQRELGLAFEAHDSSYKGSYWRHEADDGSELEVSYNEDPMFLPGDPPEEKYFEPDFKHFRVLLRASVPASLEQSVLAVVQRTYPESAVVRRRAARPTVQPGR